MDHLELTSMFLLGLSGTGHCLGMCGPLVLAFPAVTGRFSSHIYYHLGRTVTYVGIGIVMGAVGATLSFLAARGGDDPLAWVVRVQVGLSIVAAGFLLLFGLSRLGFLPEPEWMSFASPSRIPGYHRVMGSATHKKSNASMLLLGIMLGFIPCGLSFAAFARALAAGGPIEGGMLTLVFAAGTLPGLLLLGTGLSRIAARYRRIFDILSGMVMIGMAASLLTDALQAVLK
jgi:sulfite exporter TauE/SafE